MNTELLNQLKELFKDTQDCGIEEFEDCNSTRSTFGTEDDFSLPWGKYFFAYTDKTEVPMPMFCLPLQKEMYDDCIVDAHHVLLWRIEQLYGPTCDLPFDDHAPSHEETTDYSDVCPDDAIYN